MTGDLKKIADRFPLMLTASNPNHVLIFRRILEWGFSKGWSGEVGHD